MALAFAPAIAGQVWFAGRDVWQWHVLPKAFGTRARILPVAVQWGSPALYLLTDVTHFVIS